MDALLRRPRRFVPRDGASDPRGRYPIIEKLISSRTAQGFRDHLEPCSRSKPIYPRDRPRCPKDSSPPSRREGRRGDDRSKELGNGARGCVDTCPFSGSMGTRFNDWQGGTSTRHSSVPGVVRLRDVRTPIIAYPQLRSLADHVLDRQDDTLHGPPWSRGRPLPWLLSGRVSPGRAVPVRSRERRDTPNCCS
jgi:hypothetical protein